MEVTKQISVLNYGWVLVGDRKYDEKADEYILTNASVIRVWGTSKGLGELAKNGPSSSTRLDPCNGDVIINASSCIFSIECNKDKWE